MESKKPLVVKNLTKKVKQKTIVQDVSFSLEAGKITGLLGPNGAGKTTIIRLLVGLMAKSAGKIEICGETLDKDFSKAMRQIGSIIETPEFYNYLTGTENLRILAKMSNREISEERIQEVLAFVHLKEQKDQKVRTYSLGMRQRLGVAQAMVHQPKVLIFDEPMNGLDPAGMREFRELLFQLAKEGVAILISSHQLSEIEILCDELIILQKGVITRTESLQKSTEDLLTTGLLHLETSDNERAKILLEAAGYTVTAEGSVLRFHLESDTRGEIVKMLVVADLAVLTVFLEKPTLEDNFLNWTKGGELV